MITKGRKKSTNIEDRRTDTKKTNKTNNNNNSASRISIRNQKGDGKIVTSITSTPADMGSWRPRPNKPLQNGDSIEAGPQGKNNRTKHRTGR